MSCCNWAETSACTSRGRDPSLIYDDRIASAVLLMKRSRCQSVDSDANLVHVYRTRMLFIVHIHVCCRRLTWSTWMKTLWCQSVCCITSRRASPGKLLAHCSHSLELCVGKTLAIQNASRFEGYRTLYGDVFKQGHKRIWVKSLLFYAII